jgi:F-type H+-transporting ATPase subunit epsilon
MRLIVSTPFATIVRVADVVHVRAEDASGAFGVLHGHADFLTALAICVLTWRDARDEEHYIAVRGGMLFVERGETVTVATPEAVMGQNLHQLEAEVLSQFRRRIEEERTSRSDAQRLQLAAIRQIIRLLRPESAVIASGNPMVSGASVGLDG